ncbi:phenylacetate-coenzyme A ligase [Halorhodospira halochloris]|uniref:Phenylacetate-coenzyme A ligase n=1 Tax=Halorhodospira halochloris TaxID=1052 RepID=A0A0X8X7N9_HALHR|nr:phenylacetate--CoA ligase family protein [Halorhodospira halochloris]MBK1652680.1 hypothetical protein [Halorhodospira halochloris]BAU57089.1 phenylacetate-coenzyme A ligase [Halorhodospira halochloris]
MKQEQNRILYDLFKDTANRFPFWNERMRACGLLDAKGRIDLDRFSALPLLERSELVERRDELADEDYPDETWWDQTGGSTGEPVRILKNRASKQAMLQAKAQMHRWAGHRPGMPVLELWGAERDILEQRHRPPYWEWPLRQRLRCNKLVQNAFRMGEAQMRQYLAEWHWFRPRTVLAYAHSIHELARFAEREGVEVYRPQAIITSAGTLTEEMRADIRRVFGAPVFNRYGSREFGNMAMSCEQEDGLHVIPTATMIEILRPDGSPTEPDELGEIVVTSLTARAMPMIRYRIGDTGVWAEDACPCGRPFPLIKQVTGRVSDQFIAQDGSYVHGEYFTHMVWAMPTIRKFQVVQESLSRVRFRLVLEGREPYDVPVEEARLTEETRKALGADCEVLFEYPSEIEPNATGKHRFTISHVHP